MIKNITTPNTADPHTEDSVTTLNKYGASSNPLVKFIPNIPPAHVNAVNLMMQWTNKVMPVKIYSVLHPFLHQLNHFMFIYIYIYI